MLGLTLGMQRKDWAVHGTQARYRQAHPVRGELGAQAAALVVRVRRVQRGQRGLRGQRGQRRALRLRMQLQQLLHRGCQKCLQFRRWWRGVLVLPLRQPCLPCRLPCNFGCQPPLVLLFRAALPGRLAVLGRLEELVHPGDAFLRSQPSHPTVQIVKPLCLTTFFIYMAGQRRSGGRHKRIARPACLLVPTMLSPDPPAGSSLQCCQLSSWTARHRFSSRQAAQPKTHLGSTQPAAAGLQALPRISCNWPLSTPRRPHNTL